MFKVDNFGVILFVSFSYKKLLQCSFYESLKDWCKNRFSAKNSKMFVYYNEELVHKFKRNYLENYNDSEHAVKTKNTPFFMIFPNISFFHMVVNYWTGPLISNFENFWFYFHNWAENKFLRIKKSLSQYRWISRRLMSLNLNRS